MPEVRVPAAKSLRKYGMTQSEWVAMWEAQGRVCALCGGEPPPSGTMHTDHFHAKGYDRLPAHERKALVRGAIHWRCNTTLRGWVTIEWLEGALAYLRRFEARLTASTVKSNNISLAALETERETEEMPFTAGSSGGSFYKADNGTYVGEFIGVQDGPVWDRTREKEDGSQEAYKAPSMDWLFKLTKTTGEAVIDANTSEQAVGSGNTGTSMGTGRGNEAKARKWVRALCVSKGIPFEDDLVSTDEKCNALISQLIGTKALLTFGKSPQAKRDGTLLEVNPLVSVSV